MNKELHWHDKATVLGKRSSRIQLGKRAYVGRKAKKLHKQALHFAFIVRKSYSYLYKFSNA